MPSTTSTSSATCTGWSTTATSGATRATSTSTRASVIRPTSARSSGTITRPRAGSTRRGSCPRARSSTGSSRTAGSSLSLSAPRDRPRTWCLTGVSLWTRRRVAWCGKRQIIQLRKRAMSAVSSESPRTSADLMAQADDRSGAPEQSAPSRPDGARRPGAAPERDEGQAGQVSHPQSTAAGTDFGPNEWLVDELYQRYLADPGSVDRAWWNFFADSPPEPVEPPLAPPSPFPATAAPAATVAATPAAAAPPASGAAPATAPAPAPPVPTPPGPPAPSGRTQAAAAPAPPAAPAPADATQ